MVMLGALDKQVFCDELLEKYKGTPQYWHHLVHVGKYMANVREVWQIDSTTLKVEFHAGTDVKDMATALYDLNGRRDGKHYTVYTEFNGVTMEVRGRG